MAKIKCSERLVSVGISTFSECKQKILDEITSQDIPINNAVISTASAEALIHAVAAMIEENNHISSTDIVR